MPTKTSRRNFFKNTGAVSAAAMLGGVSMTACGGDASAVVIAATIVQIPAQVAVGQTLLVQIRYERSSRQRRLHRG